MRQQNAPQSDVEVEEGSSEGQLNQIIGGTLDQREDNSHQSNPDY